MGVPRPNDGDILIHFAWIDQTTSRQYAKCVAGHHQTFLDPAAVLDGEKGSMAGCWDCEYGLISDRKWAAAVMRTIHTWAATGHDVTPPKLVEGQEVDIEDLITG